MGHTVQNSDLMDDVESIYLGNLGTIDTDINLPKQGKNGSLFTWKSDEHLFLSDDGKVTRPSPGVGNRTVHLHLTATLGEEMLHKEYTVTVIQEVRKVTIDHAVDFNVIIHSKDYQLPGVVVVHLADGSYSTAEVIWNQDFDHAKASQTISGQLKENGFPVTASITLKPRASQKLTTGFVDVPVKLLGDHVYTTGYESMLQHLKNVDTDKLLYNFRSAANLPVDDRSQMTGWDAPNCHLRGHTTGHYMSALALAYFDSRDDALKNKLDDMVDQLAECQNALEKNGAHKGFLSAYDETQFDRLEHYETYPNIWAPYYTLDKILSGLLDSYVYTKNDQALTIAKGIGDWVARRLGKLSHRQLTAMWSIYIAGEFGGMISAMVRLYRYTGYDRYLRTARLFTNDKLYVPMLLNFDTLNNMHANQHIPQIIGAVDLYEETGDEHYLTIAENFWNLVVHHHAFANGGIGETEMFHEADTVSKYLTDKTIETCASYNMFKLSRQLFAITHDSKYMDYSENILNNHLLVANDHTEAGGSTYFLPLRPCGVKHYDTDADNTCCHGTGLENMVRFQKDIFAYNGSELYVHLFYDSSIILPEHRGEAVQTVSDSHVTIKAAFAAKTNLMIRLPKWMRAIAIKMNGLPVTYEMVKGYARLPELSGAVTVTLSFSKRLAIVPAADASSLAAIFYGPDMLAKKSDHEGFLELPINQLKAGTITTHGGRIMIGDQQFAPFNAVRDEHYHTYFKI